ncbi:MAG: type VI secretion system Vgr family protein [Myxococcaceae bacterium]
MKIIARISQADLDPESVVLRAEVRESLSTLFEIRVEVATPDGGLDLAAMLDTDAVLAIDDVADPSPRFFHGVVDEAEYLGAQGDLSRYQLVLRPRLHSLAYRLRSRIFQDLSAPEVVKQVITDAGIAADQMDWKVGTCLQRKICTQWRESELNFVLRLLEDEGLFFWFEHAEDKHLLTIGDSPGVHEPIPGTSSLRFVTVIQESHDPNVVRELTYRSQVVPGAVTLRDWNWESPTAPVVGIASVERFESLEQYVYPGYFSDNKDGTRRAEDRLKALHVRRQTLEGHTPNRWLAPSRKLEITGAVPEALNTEYLITSVRHVFEHFSTTEAAGGGPGKATEGGHYRAHFSAIPSNVEFRPERVTPRPFIAGKESAHVTCPPGEEIHVDEFGRIKVHFYWDREGKMDDKASCWIRVQQQNTTGSLILPRQGWEVDVGFINGDPDRPVVLQKLYNDATLPPYGLPDNLHQSSLQSSSSPGGGGTNEIKMSDGAGGMEFMVHAQKDFSLGSGHDLLEKVKVNETVQIKTDFSFDVGTTEEAKVVGDQKTSVTGACTLTTLSDQDVTVGMDEWDVTGFHAVVNGAARSEDIGGLQNVLAQGVGETFNATAKRTVGGVFAINAVGPISDATAGKKTEVVAGAKMEVIKGSKAENIGNAKALTSGLVKIKTGGDITFAAEAALGINAGVMTIQCSGDFAVSGKVVMINVGNAKLEAGAKVTLTPGSAALKGSKIGSKGTNIKLKGKVHYKK